jgi:hypothetical protein
MEYTFASAGLFLLSDSKNAQPNYQCNYTDGLLPCYSELDPQCYAVQDKCDGEADCSNGVDEVGCEQVDEPLEPTDPLANLVRTGTSFPITFHAVSTQLTLHCFFCFRRRFCRQHRMVVQQFLR